MESIFLILSGVILAAGVLYWFWSHIQLTQKKVQLLENAVFELRSLVTGPEKEERPRPQQQQSPQSQQNQPVFQDLADDDEWTGDSPAPAAAAEEGKAPVSDDLAPGGRIEVPKEEVADVPLTPDQFRDLFAKRESEVLPAPAAPPTESNTMASSSESLDSMPVKELRRLAEQRGLTGVSELRKKELLTALRQQVAAPTVVKVAVTSDTVTVERVLDLTESIGEEDAVTLE